MTPLTGTVLQGTLTLLILKAIGARKMHGLAIARRIEQTTSSAFQVSPGSLFPALHKMEEAGWLVSNWGESENNRRAKYYCLTKSGHDRLDLEVNQWKSIARAMTAAVKAV